MALGDALNQAAWAFMSDWMQKRNAQYSLRNMAKQQEGWMKYQERGSELETQRMAGMLQAQKEAATFMKYLGLSDEDAPKILQMMEMLAPLGKEIGMPIPEGLTSQVPTLAGRADVLNKSLPALLAGEFEGLDYTTMAQGAGGMQNLIRMLEQGGGTANIMAQLPTRQTNAAANLLGSMKRGMLTPVKMSDRIFTVIGRTKAGVDTIHRRFLPPSGGVGNTDQILEAVMSIMPQDTQKKNPAAKKEDARQWINKVGLEFFDDLAGLLNGIYMQAGVGDISAGQWQMVVDAASPYRMATQYAMVKEKIVSDLEKNPKYKGVNIRDLMKTDETLKMGILDDAWEYMYGFSNRSLMQGGQ